MVANSIHHCEQTLMFTDIVGYSRLMGRNEVLAVEMLGDYRSILLSHICAQGGQLVEFVGDAIFARFDTAAAAVAAAIAIQQHLLAFNEARDKKLPRLQTRIGLHKGEVMLRDGAVFGDSVNIAARLEPIAVADGICISQAVYDEIRLTLSSPAKRLGTQNLKNIQQKIRAYLIKPSGIGWRDHLHYFLCALKRRIFAYRYPLSLALLSLIAAGIYFIPRWLVPGYAANYVEIADFKNLMNEKGDADYFSAGITEAVRSQLADMRDVYIVDAKEGIHAPIRLEGSIQKLGDNLRIAYRLFRRKDNVQIVGGKLDGTYQDIFILQDRLVGEIARYLAEEFKLQNFRPAPLRLTNDVTAYDFYLRGLNFLDAPTIHANVDEAIKSFNTALVHDPKFSLAYTGLCKSYWKKYEITNLSRWLNDAEKNCLTAIDSGSNLEQAYRALGSIYRDTGRFDSSIENFKKALTLNQNDVSSLGLLASTYSRRGDKEQAEKLYLEALYRDPKNWKSHFGYAFFLAQIGRYSEAEKYYKKTLAILPENINALNNLAACYVYLDEHKKAIEIFKRAAEIDPNSYLFANIGTMYYFLRDFDKAISFYKKSLAMEPTNYQWLAFLGDAYKFKKGKREVADNFFRSVIKYAKEDIDSNSSTAAPYLYMSRAYAHFGDFPSAIKMLETASNVGSDGFELYYSGLRVALLKGDNVKIKEYYEQLVKSEYSIDVLLSDPDFSALKSKEYDWLLKTEK